MPQGSTFIPTDDRFFYQTLGGDVYPGERRRIEFLEELLAINNVCPDGYEIVERRLIVMPQGLLENRDYIYHGRCL